MCKLIINIYIYILSFKHSVLCLSLVGGGGNPVSLAKVPQWLKGFQKGKEQKKGGRAGGRQRWSERASDRERERKRERGKN